MRRNPFNLKMKPLDQKSFDQLQRMIRDEAFDGLEATLDAAKTVMSEIIGCTGEDMRLIQAARRLNLLHNRLDNWSRMVDDFTLYQEIMHVLRALEDVMILIDLKLGALMLLQHFKRKDDDDFDMLFWAT